MQGPKGGSTLEKRFPNIFSVEWSQVALCSLSYMPSVNYAQKRLEGGQGLRQVLSWLTEICYQQGWRQESCLFLIPSVKLLTSDHYHGLPDDIKLVCCLLVGRMNHVSKLLVMSVDSVLVLPFSVLWQWFLRSRMGRTRDLPSTFTPDSSYLQ